MAKKIWAFMAFIWHYNQHQVCYRRVGYSVSKRERERERERAAYLDLERYWVVTLYGDEEDRSSLERLALLEFSRSHENRVEDDAMRRILAHEEPDNLAARSWLPVRLVVVVVVVIVFERRGVERSRDGLVLIIELDTSLGNVHFEHTGSPLLPYGGPPVEDVESRSNR